MNTTGARKDEWTQSFTGDDVLRRAAFVWVDNELWPGWDDNGHSECRVIGYIGRHQFAEGPVSNYTYVIECDGHNYPARHTVVKDSLVDGRTRRRIAKAALPRLV